MVAVALVGTACARAVQPGPHGPPPVDRRDEVERLMLAGCYLCLRDALALVEQGHAVERRFDVLALLASRVRELGIRDEADWLAAATSVAAPGDTRDGLIVAIAEQARQPQGGRVFDQPDVDHHRREALGTAVSVVWPLEPAEPIDSYFFLTSRCVGLVRGDPAEDGASRPAEAPLLRYRRATCGHVDAEALAGVLAAEPRFAEIHYFAAVAALNAGALLSTERELDRFEARFPHASAAAFLRGRVLLALEEYEPAAAAFARVLAAGPTMPDALLYHMRAESHVDPLRGEAAADRLVALGTWHQGEAHYWRAWNRRALKRLEGAAADVEIAKRVMYNAAVPKLAGFIAYERNQLPLAEAELVESLQRDATDCEVQFALGQVLVRTRRWPQAAARFAETLACTRAAQEALARRVAEIREAQLDAVRQNRLQARIERQRAVERTREGLATFGAASALALSGRPAEARPLAEAALGWPELHERAADLLTRLPP
jgi:tetratricopeptide (TPR) repeat protein